MTNRWKYNPTELRPVFRQILAFCRHLPSPPSEFTISVPRSELEEMVRLQLESRLEEWGYPNVLVRTLLSPGAPKVVSFEFDPEMV